MVQKHGVIVHGTKSSGSLLTNEACTELDKRHDKSYIDAKSEQDILDSDLKSTGEFARDFINHPNLQSAVGTLGLGIKTGA